MIGIRRRGLALAIAGAPIALAARGASARQPTDAQSLERLLSMESRLLSTYDAALRRGALEEALAERLRAHEREHVRALERVVAELDGHAPIATVPQPDLQAALDRGGEGFARYALTLESRAVNAYIDAIANLDDETLRQPLGSIMACAGTHLVALRRPAGVELLPRAVEAVE